jgi:hypothetical protein
VVATISYTDGPLPLAKRRLGDAVHALADPQPVAINGGYRWTDSVYVGLRGALRGSKAGRGGLVRSAPCRIEILTLCVEIDTTVAGWEPGKTTPDRLRQHAARSFRPQDTALIDQHCGRIERWVLAAAELLTAEPRVYLHARCPRCSERFAYHRDGADERVRTRALRVSESGCRCLACGATWGPDRFHWLARLIGAPALPGAETGP